MRLIISKIQMVLLLSLVFLVLCSISVYGEEINLYVQNTEVSEDVSSWKFYSGYDSNGVSKVVASTTVKDIGNMFQAYYLKWFQKFQESKWMDSQLPIYFISYKPTIATEDELGNISYSQGSEPTDDSSKVNILDNDGIISEALGTPIGAIKGSTNYFSDSYIKVKIEGLQENTTYNIYFPSRSFYNNSTSKVEKKGNTIWENQLKSANAAEKIFAYFREKALSGIAAGSVGAGYNIGIPYSTTQRPLYDLMELKGNGYEFKSFASISYAFGYFYHPLLGNMYSNKDILIPTEKQAKEESSLNGSSVLLIDLWVRLLSDNIDNYMNGYSFDIPDEFKVFESSLSEETVNQDGYKISDIEISDSVKKLSISGASEPKDVLSYNVPMAVPYIFNVNHGVGKLDMTRLGMIENYIYCLYNDIIYNDEMKRIASMEYEVGVSRKNIYLFYQNVKSTEDGQVDKEYKTGITLIGIFEECVADTNKGSSDSAGEISSTINSVSNGISHLYLTGRKIGFKGNYSDSINFHKENREVMYVRGGDSSEQDILPRYFGFPMATKDLEIKNIFNAISGEVAASNPELMVKISELMKVKSNDEIIGYVFNRNNHGQIPDTTSGVYMLAGFAGFDMNGSSASDNAEEKDLHYSFYIIRNNAYTTMDASLVEWLRSDKAKSMSYVKSEELLAKIEGDFTKDLDFLTYEDWKLMQKVKSELEYDEDNKMIRIMNIFAIILGTILIILGVLYMLFYWVDIFNCFFDYSLVHKISGGNLYPIADKDSNIYVKNIYGNVKCVTFKDIFIIGVIMIGVGILFYNTEFIIQMLGYIYYYLINIFSSLKI